MNYNLTHISLDLDSHSLTISAMSYKKIYTSIGCNRSSNAADVDSQGLIAFAAGSYLSIWNPNDKLSNGVKQTYSGHKGDVRIVKYLQSDRATKDIISGCTSGQLILWKNNNEGYENVVNIDAHEKSISAVGTLRAPIVDRTGYLVASAGSESSLKIWNIIDKEANLLQSIDLNGKFVLDITLSLLPHSKTPVMALSLTNNRIEIWTMHNDSFVKSLSLEGHEDWVRALTFGTFSTEHGDNLVLASGSQDGYIRLWNISTHSTQNKENREHVQIDKTTLNSALLDDFERKMEEADANSSSLSTKSHVFTDHNDNKQYVYNNIRNFVNLQQVQAQFRGFVTWPRQLDYWTSLASNTMGIREQVHSTTIPLECICR